MKNLFLLFCSLLFTINAISQTALQWKEFGQNKLYVGNYKMAIHDFNKSLEINPNDYEAYYMRAVSNYSIYNLSAAITDFDKVIDLTPAGSYMKGNAYANRGLAKIDMKQNKSGCLDLNYAISLGVKDTLLNDYIEKNCESNMAVIGSQEAEKFSNEKASAYTDTHPAMREASKPTNNTKVTDIEGTTYNVVQIGNQLWMGENLNVRTFRNGDPIPQARNNEEWEKAGSTGSPAWCYYDYNPENGKIFGKLYNWYAVNDERGLGPSGYHIPSDNEWKELIDNLGGKENAGIKMKSMKLWKEYENERVPGVFEALPGGILLNGKFKGGGTEGAKANWWGTIEEGTNTWGLLYYATYAVRYGWKKESGISVRCIRN